MLSGGIRCVVTNHSICFLCQITLSRAELSGLSHGVGGFEFRTVSRFYIGAKNVKKVANIVTVLKIAAIEM